MNTTTNTTARRAATTVVLAGAAVLVAAPAFAGVSPEDTGAATSPNKAQVEHREKVAADGGLSPNNKTRFDRMDRAMRDPQPAPKPAGNTNPSDPSSVPVTVLALLGGTLIAGAAGYTIYRFRHHGPVGAATA
jgi:hypothetical protein